LRFWSYPQNNRYPKKHPKKICQFLNNQKKLAKLFKVVSVFTQENTKMKISKARLKSIILEELQNVMGEMDMLPMDSEEITIEINDLPYTTDFDEGDIDQGLRDFETEFGFALRSHQKIGNSYKIDVADDYVDQMKDAIGATDA